MKVFFRPSSRLAVVCAAIFPFVVLANAARPTAASTEVRALWVLRSSLTSPEAISTMVRSAHENGFNTLLVQVRARGDAYYAAGLEPRGVGLARVPTSFDPLGETLRQGHALGLSVHAWLNVNLVSSAVNLPVARRHVIYQHPEWVMVPRALVEDLALSVVDSPAYLGKLARWTRARSETIEGLYLSPVPVAAREYTAKVVADLVERYPVDGVHLDYARYPSSDFDYSRGSVAEFRASIAPQLPRAERDALDARATTDPFAYPDAYPARWERFRRSRLTSLIMRLRTVVKHHRPEAVLSVTAVPDADTAHDDRFQDWRTWLDAGLVDVICPMIYTSDGDLFSRQLSAVRRVTAAARVWTGIGAYRLPIAETLDRIAASRRLGADGIALFSYDSVTNLQEHEADYLVHVGRGAFGTAKPLTAGSP